MPIPATTVIIPYYQRTSGLLERAVRSALVQRNVPLPLVVVVDDGSPVRADTELVELSRAFPDNIVMLTQKNAGPAAARNTGLRYAEKGQFIAFLDSDDVWEPDHLKTALAALGHGLDFYFCDAVHRDSERTVFESKAFPNSNCCALPQDARIYEYAGDFFQLILDACPIPNPSAVVYRLSSFPLKFRETLRTAGEDHLFWLQAAYLRKRVGFSTNKNVKLGTGVSVYAGVQWATNARVEQIYFNQAYISALPHEFDLSPRQRSSCRTRHGDQRQALMANVWSMFAHGRTPQLRLLMRYAMLDPLVLAHFPLYMAQRLAAAARRFGAARFPLIRKGR